MSTAPLIAWRLDGAHLAVPVDLRIYTVDAVLRAAYKLTDRCFVFLDRQGRDDELTVFLVGRSAADVLDSLALEFHNELLDQQLRCRLEQGFGDVRTLIVAQAFAEGNLLDPYPQNHEGDPLGAGEHR